jgi:hypothetical protein
VTRRRLAANKLDRAIEVGSKKLYFLSVDFLQEAGPRFLPASWRIRAGGGTRVRLRSSLSPCRSRWSGLLPAGPKTATRTSYADARFANRTRSSATAVAASSRTMSIMIGSGSVGAAVSDAEGHLPSCQCFLFLTRITACWRAARHCCGALWSTVHGRKRRRSSRMLIAYRIPPLCVAGRKGWTSHNRFIPLPARRLRERLSGWNLLIQIRAKRSFYPG